MTLSRGTCRTAAATDAHPPLLRSDRARRAVVGMLVISHDEQLVGDAREAPQIPRLADRHRDGDQPAVTREPLPRFVEQLRDNAAARAHRAPRSRTPRRRRDWRRGTVRAGRANGGGPAGRRAMMRAPAASTCPLEKFWTTGRISGRCCAALITARPLRIGKDAELVVGPVTVTHTGASQSRSPMCR